MWASYGLFIGNINGILDFSAGFPYFLNSVSVHWISAGMPAFSWVYVLFLRNAFRVVVLPFSIIFHGFLG